MVNVPIGDMIGVRLAGIYVNRDGYTTNLYDGSDIDTRDLYALRGSLRFEPGPDTTIDLMGYYFREKDTSLRNQKQKRSEERHVGKEWVNKGRYRWWPH